MALDKEAQAILADHRSVWQRKPILQRIYKEEFFARLAAACRPNGLSVEVGGGPGFLKERLPGSLSTDVVWCPWLDAVTDAQQLPFKAGRVANIVGLDILHHLVEPMAFLREAERVLAP